MRSRKQQKKKKHVSLFKAKTKSHVNFHGFIFEKIQKQSRKKKETTELNLCSI